MSSFQGLRVFKIKMPEVLVGVDAVKKLGEVARAFGNRALAVAGRAQWSPEG